MDKDELVSDLAQAITLLLVSQDGREVQTTEIAERVVERMTQELHLTIASVRQVGWIEHDQHMLMELETEDDYREADWYPVFEFGSTAIGAPPLDLDDE